MLTRSGLRYELLLATCVALAVAPGCGSLRPRNFRAMANPAPVVRAGAVSMADSQPDGVAIPAWIRLLDDKDPVVRMAANESLKTRTGQDFQFVAWGEAEERAPAVARWKAWWKARLQGQVYATPQDGLATKGRAR